MPLIALEVPPGVYRQGTDYQSRGRFYDADLWRWHGGASGPIGGWVARSSSVVSGKARAVISWLANSSTVWTGVGTHTGLYAVSRSGSVSDITPSGFVAGRADAVIGGGYGEGVYGAGLYGTPRLTSTNIVPASVWSLDTWGEYLVGTMGSIIYEWQLSVAADAVAIAGAPTANAILVTDERILFALGTDDDPRAIDWCDAEDNTDWTPTATNLAGGKRLQTNGGLQCGRRVTGAYLIWTDSDVHRATFVGLPLVYSFERLETGCGVASKGAPVVAANGQVFWFGVNDFWRYNGYVDAVPCEVKDYVFNDLNRTQISKVSGWHNSLWGEVWWHYPSSGSTEVDRYVSFNYRENTWMIGALSRLCGVDRAPLADPQMVGADGYVYSHETGDLKDARQPYARSGPVELGEGDRTMEVHAYIPDEATLGSLAVSFSVADYPMDAPTTVAAVTATAKTDLRFSARKVAVTYTGDADVDFRMGRVRFDVKPGSGR